jgi:hypothetical protein
MLRAYTPRAIKRCSPASSFNPSHSLPKGHPVTAKLLQLLKWIFLPVTIALGISLYLVWLCVSSLGGILLIFGPIFLGLYLFKNGFGFLFGIGLIALLMWVTTHFENQLEKLSDLWERISEGILKFYGKLLPFSSNNGSMTVESHKRLKVRTSGEKRRRRTATRLRLRRHQTLHQFGNIGQPTTWITRIGHGFQPKEILRDRRRRIDL